MLYKKLREKIYTLEVVIDAVLIILNNKDIVTRKEIQDQIFKTEDDDETVRDTERV